MDPTKSNYCEINACVDHEMTSQLVDKIKKLCTRIVLYKTQGEGAIGKLSVYDRAREFF